MKKVKNQCITIKEATLSQKRLDHESMYDRFYAVCANLKFIVGEITNINMRFTYRRQRPKVRDCAMLDSLKDPLVFGRLN